MRMKKRIGLIFIILVGSLITLWSGYNIYDLINKIQLNENNRHSIPNVLEKDNPANNINKVYEIFGAHLILIMIFGLTIIIIGIIFLRKSKNKH